MDYFCKICDKFIKPKNKHKHIKSNTHKEFDKRKHIKFIMENPDINNVDRAFYEYIIQHNKNYDYYLFKCQFKLIFNDNQYCPYDTSILSDDKTMNILAEFFRKRN